MRKFPVIQDCLGRVLVLFYIVLDLFGFPGDVVVDDRNSLYLKTKTYYSLSVT